MAEILGKSKMTDVYDSVLYGRVRERFDKECADAPDESREALEVLADMVSQVIRRDSALCGKVLEGGKSLSGAYEGMRKVVEARVKPKRGVVSCGMMAPDEAERVVLSYFGIEKAPASRGAAASESVAEEKGGTSMGVTSLFDLL